MGPEVGRAARAGGHFVVREAFLLFFSSFCPALGFQVECNIDAYDFG